MAYQAEIGQRNPTLFLFLIDQSGSMHNPFGGDNRKRKSEGVADALNRLLHGLVMRCSRGTEIVDRYFVGAVGYNNSVRPAFGGALAGRYQVPISEVGQNPLRIESRIRKTDDGAGGILEQKIQFPIWLDPAASGKTKMREALEMAQELAADFVGSFPNCFPPIVINITDGVPSDGTAPDYPEVERAAQQLCRISSSDGQVLLFNVHISSENAPPIEYPNSAANLPGQFSQLLFRMSSALPAPMREQARVGDVVLSPDARGFVFQGTLVSVIGMLDIGTRFGGHR